LACMERKRTVEEIAAATDLSLPSVYNAVRTLVAKGMITCTGGSQGMRRVYGARTEGISKPVSCPECGAEYSPLLQHCPACREKEVEEFKKLTEDKAKMDEYLENKRKWLQEVKQCLLTAARLRQEGRIEEAEKVESRRKALEKELNKLEVSK